MLGHKGGKVVIKEVWLVSGNKNKQKEFKKIIKEKSLQDIMNICFYENSICELQTEKMDDLIRHKALETFKSIKRPLLVEHTSLHLKAWGDFPGGLTQIIWKQLGAEGFIKLTESNRKAIARTYLGYIDGGQLKVYIGEIEGEISKEAKGEHGFGWDPIFIPDGQKITFGEMKRKEKNKISMRRKAIELFLEDMAGERSAHIE